MLKYWLLASRPKTLVASLLPVVAGFLLAYEQSPNVSKVTGILCLLYCLLVQIGTNFANDYYDFLKGADDRRENAPQRMVSSGLIKPKVMFVANAFKNTTAVKNIITIKIFSRYPIKMLLPNVLA